MTRSEQDWLDDLARRQRLDLFGDLAGAVAHQLNNALGVVNGYEELLLEGLDDVSGRVGDAEREGLRARARTVHTWTGTALAAARRLHEMSARLREEEVDFDVAQVAAEAVELCRYRCEREGILLLFESDPVLPEVHGRPGEILHALVNLVQNAREAIRRAGDEEGTVRVATEAVRVDGAAWVRVTVEDDGPGVDGPDPEGMGTADTAGIFDVGVSVKQEEGAGLGLPVARRAAERAGGTLRAESGEGGRFVLQLPGVEPGG